MKSKNLRTFNVDDREMIFDVRYFQEMFIRQAKKNNLRIGEYEEELAKILYVDKSAVHNWRMEVNGPGDIEKIQQIADFWNINYKNLLMEGINMNKVQAESTQKLKDNELMALRNVYRDFLVYMKEFDKSVGFNWNPDDGSEYNAFVALARYEDLKCVLETEYIDLKRTVYDVLETFFDGELSYTLEQVEVEEDTGSLEGDVLRLYEYLLGQFKEIVDKYLVD